MGYWWLRTETDDGGEREAGHFLDLDLLGRGWEEVSMEGRKWSEK